MRLRFLVSAGVFAAVVLMRTPNGDATTMLPLDLPSLTARAELVVSGKIVDTHAAWTPSHDAIYTEVSLRVDRTLAGSAKPGETVVFRREGGSVDGIGMKVYGAAAFAKDEDVVVFLERRGTDRYVVGMAQGKMRLFTDVAGVRRLSRDLSEVAFTRTPTAAERAPMTVGPAPRPISTLDELAAAVGRLSTRARKAP